MRKNLTIDEELHKEFTEAANSDGFSTGRGRSGQVPQYIRRLLKLRDLARARDWRKLWALVDNNEGTE